MNTLYIMIGYSGSGKSTWAKNFVKDKSRTVIVSPDAFRSMLHGDYEYRIELDEIITHSCYFIATQLLAEYDVIIDCGNLTTSLDRRGLWKLLPAKKRIAIVMPMKKYPQWYVSRRMKKPHWERVDWLSVVKAEMKVYQPPTFDEFDEIVHIKEDGSVYADTFPDKEYQ